MQLSQLVACALLLTAALVQCQQVSPLQGRGFPPDSGLDIYVTVILDRLLSVDDVDYRFTAMLYFQFSWRDARALPAMYNATQAGAESGACGLPCTSMHAWTPGALCCDGIFLPSMEFVNVYGFSQDRPVRWRVAVQETGDAVVWWSYVEGTYYTPLTFKAFPFDKQYLLVQVQYANRNTSIPVRFISSATGLQLFRPETGDDVSGWEAKGIEVLPFDYSKVEGELLRSQGTTYSHPDDPWPLNPANDSVEAFQSQIWHQGFVIALTVYRTSTYYIVVAILPIAVNVWLCLLVFFISPRHLDTRLGCIITMFLSLTAIQFVLSTVLPSSSTIVPTQQLVIVSYVVMAFIGIVSIGVFFIVTAEKQQAKREQGKVASRSFTQRWVTMLRSQVSGKAASAGDAPSWRTKSLPVAGQGEAAVDGGASREGAGRGSEAEGVDGAGEAEGEAGAVERGAVGGWESSRRFGGLGICGEVSKGQLENKVSDDDADDDDDAKSYKSSDSEKSLCSRGLPLSRASSVHAGAAAAVATAPAPAAAVATTARGGELHLRPSGGSRAPAGGMSTRVSWAAGGWASGSGDLEAGARHHQQQHKQREAGGEGEEEVGGGSKPHGKEWRGCSWGQCRWVCSWPARWMRLQRLKLKEMMREARESKEYAEHLAHKLDRCAFWFVLVGYNVALIVIFAVGAQQQPELALPTVPAPTSA